MRRRRELDFAQAKANLDLNESIVNSRKQLFAEGAIPGRDLDTAQAALVQAQAAYDAAAKHSSRMKTVSREAALKTAQGQLTSAEGKMKGADAQVGYSEIRSPIDGVVTDRPLFAGETAAAGAPLITVMDTSSLLAKAHIAQSLVQQMKVGDDAEIQVPGIEGSGGCESLADQSGAGSRQHDGRSLAQDRQQGRHAEGRNSGEGRHHRDGRSTKALKIPKRGPDRAGRSKSVMVVGADGAAHKKAVTLGIPDGDDVQVSTALRPPTW